ncbi:hypothetical protein Tco_1116405, partial [Tanacetum coccineum]
ETMAIRISRRNNTYDARNNRLTSRYLLLPHSDFGFRITNLGSRFMTFPKRQKSNPAKDSSWNYYRDSSDHISYQRQQKLGGDGRLYSESMPELDSAKTIIIAGSSDNIASTEMVD